MMHHSPLSKNSPSQPNPFSSLPRNRKHWILLLTASGLLLLFINILSNFPSHAEQSLKHGQIAPSIPFPLNTQPSTPNITVPLKQAPAPTAIERDQLEETVITQKTTICDLYDELLLSKKQIENKEREIDFLREQVVSMESSSMGKEDLLNALSQERTENEQLLTRLSNTRKQHLILQEKFDYLEEKSNNLYSEVLALGNIHEKYQQNNEQLIAYEQENQTLQQSVQQQQQDLFTIKTSRSQLENELSSTKKEYVSLLNQVKPQTPLPTTHKVSKGETLSTISKQYYGTTRHWKLILEANHNTISHPDKILLGTTLLIPEIPEQ